MIAVSTTRAARNRTSAPRRRRKSQVSRPRNDPTRPSRAATGGRGPRARARRSHEVVVGALGTAGACRSSHAPSHRPTTRSRNQPAALGEAGRPLSASPTPNVAIMNAETPRRTQGRPARPDRVAGDAERAAARPGAWPGRAPGRGKPRRGTSVPPLATTAVSKGTPAAALQEVGLQRLGDHRAGGQAEHHRLDDEPDADEGGEARASPEEAEGAPPGHGLDQGHRQVGEEEEREPRAEGAHEGEHAGEVSGAQHERGETQGQHARRICPRWRRRRLNATSGPRRGRRGGSRSGRGRRGGLRAGSGRR